jgi:phosphoglycolate phosphatase-like HAD superfamily hydrolase
MIKLVAFEWNGTLLSDTVCCWEGANKEYAVCGVKPISLLRFRQTFDIPYLETMVANGASREYVRRNSKRISQAFHSFYEPRAANCRTRSGVRGVLDYLHKNKILAMIFSNHTLVGIQAQVKRLGIAHHIDLILAHAKLDGAIHEKNKGEKLRDYVKGRKLHPDEVLVIGDSEEELEIGKQYGYHTVGITGGYNTTARLKKHHPDFLIHNMKELVGIIKKLNK